jgi:hypothetical protein
MTAIEEEDLLGVGGELGDWVMVRGVGEARMARWMVVFVVGFGLEGVVKLEQFMSAASLRVEE